MKNVLKLINKKIILFSVLADNATVDPTIIVREGSLGFKIPTFSDILTFGIRAFFTIAGILALFALLQGGLAWVTSGGAKESVQKAQEKIQAAIVGMIIIVAVLAIIATFEQVVFSRRICFGLTCAVTIPGLLVVCNPQGTTSASPDWVQGAPACN